GAELQLRDDVVMQERLAAGLAGGRIPKADRAVDMTRRGEEAVRAEGRTGDVLRIQDGDRPVELSPPTGQVDSYHALERAVGRGFVRSSFEAFEHPVDGLGNFALPDQFQAAVEQERGRLPPRGLAGAQGIGLRLPGLAFVAAGVVPRGRRLPPQPRRPRAPPTRRPPT